MARKQMSPAVTTDPPCFLGSDAWLLAAIHTADSGNSQPTLVGVIAVGDAINHAIFTRSELDGGLSRLVRAGLVTVNGQRFGLTPLGREMAAKDPGTAKGVSAHVESIRKRLHASEQGPRTDPNDAWDPGAPKVYVSEEDFRIAVDEYQRLFRSR
ncbi:MAG: hypothetical protein MI919_13680 [Holophagales bacterium]|nr:hypothetical protein [Holophagales bacterium]